MSTDPDSATVVRINGAPGCGKTTTLLEKVEEHRANGTDVSDIYYLTFTRSGRDEVKNRLIETFPDEDEEDVKRRAKTVHGAACSAALQGGVIDDPGEQIIQPGSDDDVYQRFCNRHGLSFSSKERTPLKTAKEGREVNHSGNKLLGIYNWLKYTRKPYKQLTQAPNQRPADYQTTLRLLNAWDAFKRDGDANGRDCRLFEHADYVDEAIDQLLVPDADIFFIDEFQDFSPQEYLLFRTWRDSGLVDRMYIAGDENQSIYSFRAGTPLYFQETDVDETENRTLSYRCPAEIVAVARGVLDGHPETNPNGFQAHDRGGRAERRTVALDTDLADLVRQDIDAHEPNDEDNTVFLLARTNRMAGQIGNVLEEAGIQFSLLGKGGHYQPWSDPLPALYKAMRAIGKGKNVMYSPEIVRARLVEYLPNSKRKAKDALAELAEEADPHAVIPQLDLYYNERERLRNAVEAGDYTDPGAVKVGTIHSAKGLEAPAVHLFDSYTSRLRNSYHSGENAAEEHRLYYVGATRASETLRVINFDELGDHVFPGFRHGLPEAKEAIA